MKLYLTFYPMVVLYTKYIEKIQIEDNEIYDYEEIDILMKNEDTYKHKYSNGSMSRWRLQQVIKKGIYNNEPQIECKNLLTWAYL